jgi:hypothetical protein
VRSKGIIESKKLKDALAKTFKSRGTTLSASQFDSAGLKSLQKLWTAHLNGLGDIAEELALPQNVETTIEEINHGVGLV